MLFNGDKNIFGRRKKILNLSESVKTLMLCGLGAVMLIFIIGYFNNADLYKLYTQLQSTSTSNFDKKLAFVSSLVNSTGNADYALALGFTKEQADQMVTSNAYGMGFQNPITGEPEQNPQDPNAPTQNLTQVGGPPVVWTSSNWQEAVAEHNRQYESTGADLKTDGWSYGSNGFLKQNQSTGSYWGSAGRTGNTLMDKGCMWFTLATIVTNVTGNVYGVENLLVDVGYTVSFSNKKWQVSPTIIKVGQDSAHRHPGGTGTVPSTPYDILAACNAGISVSSNLNFSELENCTFSDGEMFLVHIADDTEGRMASTTNREHWFIIYGKSGTDFLIANGGGSARNSGKGDIAYARTHLNCIYKVVAQ